MNEKIFNMLGAYEISRNYALYYAGLQYLRQLLAANAITQKEFDAAHSGIAEKYGMKRFFRRFKS